MNLIQLFQTVWQMVRQKPLDIFLYLVVGGIVIKLLSLYFSVSVDDGNWEQFRLEHHCQIQVSSGKQDSGWLCDDGKVYYRWRQQR